MGIQFVEREKERERERRRRPRGADSDNKFGSATRNGST